MADYPLFTTRPYNQKFFLYHTNYQKYVISRELYSRLPHSIIIDSILSAHDQLLFLLSLRKIVKSGGQVVTLQHEINATETTLIALINKAFSF